MAADDLKHQFDFKSEVMEADFSLEVWAIRAVSEGDDMTLFRLDASIRVEGSASREIADIVEARVAFRPSRRHRGTSAHRR